MNPNYLFHFGHFGRNGRKFAAKLEVYIAKQVDKIIQQSRVIKIF